jgi:hypothetical protein
MKKIKLITLSVFLISISYFSYGQLSERVNSNSSFKIGTRPVQGNLGIFIGLNRQDFNDLANRWSFDNKKQPMDSVKNFLPIISLRYYISDDNAVRFGINSRRSNLKIKGTFSERPDKLTELEYQRAKSYFYINPGFEHHFLKSNLADVYLGASIPIGVVSEKHDDFLKGGSDYSSRTASRLSISYGAELFFGIQAFIADLPLSIGLEVGTSALVISGKKWKVEYKNVSTSGGTTTTTSETYYTLNLASDDIIDTSSPIYSYVNSNYKSLKAKSSTIDGMARITLCYYFGK